MKSPKERAKELVAQMTLAEKCAQMKYDAPAIERLGVPAYNLSLIHISLALFPGATTRARLPASAWRSSSRELSPALRSMYSR